MSAGGYHHHLGANTWESAGAPPAPAGTAALRHATILLPDDAERERVAARLEDAGHPPEERGDELAVRDQNTGTLSAVSGNSAIYTLCGLGPNCAIAAGTPSAARLLLLRREALELALYTFKYIGSIENVVAILPPGRTTVTAALTKKPPSPGQTATTSQVNLAVVFQRQSLKHFLDRPLRMTLPGDLPPTVAQMPNAPEAELVSVITGQVLFSQRLIQSQDGSSVLVLDPQPAQ
jgi:hypothetical protein